MKTGKIILYLQRVASCAARLRLAAGPRAAGQGVRRQAGPPESDDSNMQQEYSIFFSLHLMVSIAEGKKYLCVVLVLVVLHEPTCMAVIFAEKTCIV